jgi:rfaE bifunctional protein nucleotidyltransferase chain/domain
MEQLVTHDGLAPLGSSYRADEKKLVLTNGCFDLLHTGHVRYLQQARELGDALVVAVNSDASVRELKGPLRPLNDEQERAEVLAALRCVDHVTVFTGKRVTEVIRELRPSIYAKGGDYTLETLDPEERAALEEVGAEIRLLALVPGKSTTSLLEKAKT